MALAYTAVLLYQQNLGRYVRGSAGFELSWCVLRYQKTRRHKVNLLTLRLQLCRSILLRQRHLLHLLPIATSRL